MAEWLDRDRLKSHAEGKSWIDLKRSVLVWYRGVIVGASATIDNAWALVSLIMLLVTEVIVMAVSSTFGFHRLNLGGCQSEKNDPPCLGTSLPVVGGRGSTSEPAILSSNVGGVTECGRVMVANRLISSVVVVEADAASCQLSQISSSFNWNVCVLS